MNLRAVFAGDLEADPSSGATTLDGPIFDTSVAARRTSGADPGDDPARIGRYAVIRRIGRGGMGVVYLGFDEQLDRKVAIKLLHGGAAGEGRLLREAQALARLSHPNVVAVHEVAEAEGRVYLAMEFVGGETLRQWLAAGRPWREVLAVFVQAGQGLAAAHAVGLVHRDFKPDNAIVGADGRVRVFDFGLARASGISGEEASEEAGTSSGAGALSAALTVAGTMVGTPGYMPPEQFRGEAADARADVFSFCASLYEALYAVRPFLGADLRSLYEHVQCGMFEEPESNQRVAGWLRPVLARGLRSDPEQRWQSMDALLAALTADPEAARRRTLRRVGLAALALSTLVAAPFGSVAAADAWARRRGELHADGRLAALRERTAALAAEGRAAEAEAAFEAFVQAEEHRGTRALSEAWQERGRAAQARQDGELALHAFTQAYAQAPTEPLARAAMSGLAEVQRARWAWDAAGHALSALEEGGPLPPEAAPLQVDEALARRDFPAALAAISRLAPDDGEALRAVRPVLEHMSFGTHTGRAAAAAVPTDSGLLLGDLAMRRLERVGEDLRPGPAYVAPESRWHPLAGSSLALTRVGDELRLYALGDAAQELWRGPGRAQVYTAAAADLDRDGAPEVYFSFGYPDRGLFRAAPGRPLEEVHPPTAATDSDVEAICVVDLDGDGADELLVAVGAFHAYDLRVLRPGPRGLEMIARRPVGQVAALGTYRGPGGALRIAAVVDERLGNREVFPTPPHRYAPAGVYLFEWTDGELREVGRAPLPRRLDGTAARVRRRLLVGDLDGDALDDLVLQISTAADDRARGPDLQALLLRQRGDGSLASARLGSLTPLALIERDGDPARELLAAFDEPGGELWVLGAGEEPVPPRPRPPGAIQPAPEELADPALMRAWDRAERLAQVGLPAEAAAVLGDAALAAPAGPLQGRLHLRAGEQLATAGDHAGALAVLQPLTHAPGVAARARLAAAASAFALGRHAEADAAAAAALALPELPRSDRARGEALRREVAPLIRPGTVWELRFDAPLAPAWRIDDPLAALRDPVDQALRVTGSNGQVASARLPVAWDGGALDLEVELALERIEYGAAVHVALLDDAGRAHFSVGVSAGGGGGLVTYGLSCHRGPPQGERRSSASDERHALSLRATFSPATLSTTCALREDGRVVETSRDWPELPRPGRYWLAIGALDPRVHGYTATSAAIRELSLQGVRVLEDDVAVDPLAGARASLAEGDPAAALALLDAAEVSDPLAPYLRALAEDELGREDLRDATIAAALQGEVDPALRDALLRGLRLRPEALGPALRGALGADYLTWFHASWESALHHHRYDPAMQRALVRSVGDLDELAPRTPLAAQHRFALLAYRGQAWLLLGDAPRAREDLRAAEALADAVEGLGDGRFHARFFLSLARVEPPARARALIERALAASPNPDLLREQIADDPELGPLAEL